MEAALPNHIESLDQTTSNEGLRAVPLICFALMCAATMWNAIDIASDDEIQAGLDWVVAIKLVITAFAGIVGGLGFLMDPRVRRTLLSGPGLILSLLGFVFLSTSVFAFHEVANVCRAASVIYIVYLVFIATALSVVRLRGVIIATLIGSVINLVLNWGLYLTGHGAFEELLGDQVFVSRMGGLGHPNAIARVAMLAGLLSVAMLRSRELSPKLPIGRLVLYGIIVLSVMTAIATFSRTSIVAATAALFFLMSDKISSRGGMAVMFAGLAFLVASFLVFELASGGGMLGDSLLSVTTKTGDVQELTSATGRTDIWAEAIRLIGQRPVTGWGLNSAPVLLEDFSYHTHNLVLHATFSGGILAGFFVVTLLAWNFFFGLTSKEPIIRSVSMYVLVSGVLEDTVLDTFASTATLLWLLVLLYPAMSALKEIGPFENNESPVYNEPTVT